jgi:hypothetical protein
VEIGCKNTRKMNTKKIEVKQGEREKIARLFNCDKRTVFNALRFRCNSRKSTQIRAYALRNGGMLFESNN